MIGGVLYFTAGSRRSVVAVDAAAAIDRHHRGRAVVVKGEQRAVSLDAPPAARDRPSVKAQLAIVVDAAVVARPRARGDQ